MTFSIQELKLSLQFHDLFLVFFVLVLLRNRKKVLDFSPTPTSQTTSSFLYLPPSLKSLALRYELLYFTAIFWAELLLIEQFIEKAFDYFHARVDECLVLTDRHLCLHECENAVFWEGWEDIPWLFFGKDLSRRKTYLVYECELRIPSLDREDPLIVLIQLKVVELVLEQTEIHFILAGLYLHLVDLYGCLSWLLLAGLIPTV